MTTTSESLGIYAYNGGLFDPQLHPQLEHWQIGDLYLAEALRLLACTEVEGRRGFLDYSALDVRELGSIYEGLLEHKLIRKDGELVWEKDRSQRKKTGSYYTPEYIVQYIVEQTIGPLIGEIQSGLKTDLDELTEKIRRARGENRKLLEKKKEKLLRDARERVLDLKILDPAMGSGHFLVSACDYVARRIAELEADLAGKETEEAVQALKRTVAERCLYGVDLNPLATELAKLSLWLHTVAKGQPLSFLNHHLRTGNSLIGARVKDLERPPSGKAHEIGLWESKLVQDLAKAIGYLNFIKASASASRSDIEEKKQRWELVNAWIGKYKQAADVWLSSYFGNAVSDDAFHKILEAAASGTMDGIGDSPVFRQAQKIAAEKHFFHWELEFPDAFFDKFGRRLENPGFDAVIGNPPWGGTLENLEKQLLRNQNSEYLSHIPDMYSLFMARFLTHNLIQDHRYLSFVVPDTWTSIGATEGLRRFILTSCHLERAAVLGSSAFPDVSANVTVFVLVLSGRERKTTIDRFVGSEQVVSTAVDTEIYESIGYRILLSQFDLSACSLALRLKKENDQLEEIVEARQGLIPYSRTKHANTVLQKRAFHAQKKLGSEYKKLLRGSDTARYQASWNGHDWIKYGPWLHCPREPGIFKGKRILVREITGPIPHAIYATETREELYHDPGIIALIPREERLKGYELKYVLSLINSLVMSFYQWLFAPKSSRDLFPKLLVGDLRQFPFRRIGFVTPEDERARLVEEGKRLYFEALAKLGLEADNQSTNDTPPAKSKSAGGGAR